MFGQEKEEVFREAIWNRETGYCMNKLKLYNAAITRFDASIKIEPDDGRTLWGRAYSLAQKLECARSLADIEHSLQITPDNLTVLQQKAWVTYLSGEFEAAIIQNYRGCPKRSVPPIFQHGVLQCQDAIENCIGEVAGHPLRDFCQVIRRLEDKKRIDRENLFKRRWKRATAKVKKAAVRSSGDEPIQATAGAKSGAKELPKPTETDNVDINLTKEIIQQEKRRMSRMSRKSNAYRESCADNEHKKSLTTKPKSVKMKMGGVPSGLEREMHIEDFTVLPEEVATQIEYKPIQPKTLNIKNTVNEKYLERLHYDRTFYERTLHDPKVKCPNKKGTAQIKHLARRGYNTLQLLEDALRTRKPFYSIRYHESQLAESLLERQQQELLKLQMIFKAEADNMIRQMRYARCDRNTRLCLDLVDRAKTFFDIKNLKYLPTKDEYLETVYNIAALANLDTKRLDLKVPTYDREKRVLYVLGLPMSREPSRDSLIKSNKSRVVDHKKLVKLIEARITRAKTPTELAWLFHDLALSNCELKKLDLSRHYARRCVEQADNVGHEIWAINGLFIVAKIDSMQHNRNDAKGVMNEIWERAVKLELEPLLDFVQKARDIIAREDVEEPQTTAVIQKREQAIVDLVAPGMKDDVAFLFRRMSAMPASRRMSIMPGVRMGSEENATSRNSRQNRPSIMPNKEKIEEVKIPTAKAEHAETEFMGMIADH